MHKRTKALDITPKVKQRVWERDNYQCIVCGSPYAMPNAHYIARSHSGLGIEQNIVTLCQVCHHNYDNTADRGIYKDRIRNYLMEQYPEWDEDDLIYRKWSM